MGSDVSAAVDAANPGQTRIHWENETNPAVTVSFAPKLVVFDTIGSALGSAGTFVFCDERGAEQGPGIDSDQRRDGRRQRR